MQDILEGILGNVRAIALWIAFALFLESFWPREMPMPLVRRLRSLLFTLIYVIAGAVIGKILSVIFGNILFKPFFVVPGALGLVFAACVGDFFYYWMHRFQHNIPFLWKYHSVHHSIERMGAGTGYQHVSQPFIEIALVTIPASLFVETWQVAELSTYIGFLGYYLHSTSRLNAGLFRIVLVDNKFHRIHHSLEPRHFNKNFGVVTTIWDSLFGTAHFPEKDEWPATGLRGRREPDTIREFLMPLAVNEKIPMLNRRLQ